LGFNLDYLTSRDNDSTINLRNAVVWCVIPLSPIDALAGF